MKPLSKAPKPVTFEKLKPKLVDVIDMAPDGQGLAPITPGLQHSDRAVTVQLEDYERDYGASEIHADDVAAMADVYPMDDLDTEAPISDRVTRTAGILIELGLTDRPALKQAMGTAVKKLRLQGDAAKYDQQVSGLKAQALNSMAGARHGYKPARLMYRLAHQTKWERWWKTFGHDDGVESNFFRRFMPGPKIRAEDISYWMVIRSCWHCYRPHNNMLQITAYSDIPTDAPPEEFFGDDWKVLEGLPQQRIGDKRKQPVKNEEDLLFCVLGYRSGRGGMLFGEWVDFAKSAGKKNGKIEDVEEEEDPDSMKGQLKGLLRSIIYISLFIGAFCGLIWLAGWLPGLMP